MSPISTIFFITYLFLCVESDFEPNWKSLDSRKLPSWYDEAKFGIFVHWGVYSVPSFGSEWFWRKWQDNKSSHVEFMQKNYKPGFTYQDFAKDFTAEFYDPVKWAEIFQASGAKYVVPTSKHHEGYAMWPSKYSFSWNSMDVGPHRDLLGELADAIRNTTDLRFGVYHSLFEWFNPLWLGDVANNFATNDFVRGKVMPEMMELVLTYQPEVLWSDGDWDAPYSYWNSTHFIAWLYNTSPVKDTIVTNDRWGRGVMCKHGDFYTCQDRFNPGVLLHHKWENCLTIDKKSWGYRRNAELSDFNTYEELIEQLVSTVSCGGNMLLNVGPTHDGIIAPLFEERLRSIGKWLKVNGEAIYASKPWTHQKETVQPGVWYTKRDQNVYATILERPKKSVVVLHRPKVGSNYTLTIVGYDGDVKSYPDKESGITVVLPDISKVHAPLPWVLRITNVTN